jgi:hypothetical protein
MLFLYDLPHLVMLALITVTITAVGVGLHIAFRRFVHFDPTDEQKSLALAVLPILSTVHSLLLAFTAVSVWEAYSGASSAVVAEANTVGQLARDLGVYGSAESAHARSLLRDYAQTIVDTEWQAMKHGDGSLVAWQKFDVLFRSIGKLEADTPQREALMSEVWARTNELVRLRRDRIGESTSAIPSTLWVVVIVGTLLTMAVTFVLPTNRFNVIMNAALACSVGLVFSFIIAMDRPFAGEESISPAPFESAIANMDRWDIETQGTSSR